MQTGRKRWFAVRCWSQDRRLQVAAAGSNRRWDVYSRVEIDACRLAWLAIAFLVERGDSLDQYLAQAGIDTSYRSVFRIGFWVYPLHGYHSLVRERFGDTSASAVWQCQRHILEDGQPGTAQAVELALDLVDKASRAEALQYPSQRSGSAIPLELFVAMALLMGLPESPNYISGQRRRLDPLVPGDRDVEWQLAELIARTREEMRMVIQPIFDRLAAPESPCYEC